MQQPVQGGEDSRACRLGQSGDWRSRKNLQVPGFGEGLEGAVIGGFGGGRKAASGELLLLEVGFDAIAAESARLAGGVGTRTGCFAFFLVGAIVGGHGIVSPGVLLALRQDQRPFPSLRGT